ncbi:Protein SERAC1, partial [Lachnellula suecica]
MSASRDERPKKARTISFKNLATVTSGWSRKSGIRASTTATLVETPSDHVHDIPAATPKNSGTVASSTDTIPLRSKTALAKTSELEIPYHLGLRALHPASDTPTCPVDIIALHGINGNARTTWTHQHEKTKRKEFWLQDYLPLEFPGARIYTFGYDARVFFSLGTGDIGSFATSLLEDVRNVRTKREEQRRPIIFIAHSMGGLVVKKALTVARNDPARFGNIVESTSAIFFMATPHRGSDHAATLGAIAKIVNFPFAKSLINRLTGEIREDLILGLKKDGPGIRQIATDFSALTDGSIRFFSFIEMNKTKPLKRKIVDEVTGKMDVAPETVIYMDGKDHKSIVRFESRQCPSYLKVVANMREAVNAATD